MNLKHATKEDRAQLARDNLNYPEHLVAVPHGPARMGRTGDAGHPLAVWRSRRFLVTHWLDRNGHQRLTCQRTKLTPAGEWVDGITWDDLQRLKGEAGFADHWAVEVYPPDKRVTNVANLRHLWLLPTAPDFAWNRS